VQEARRLLVETTLSIKEVAARCGYDRVSQFDRQFGRQCGMTPGVYRFALAGRGCQKLCV
jgi:AraC-like DNA-binding protein